MGTCFIRIQFLPGIKYACWDHVICHVRQRCLTPSFLLNCRWSTYGRVGGWGKVKDAYTTEATTMGVISALLLSLSFNAVLTGPPASATGGGNSSSVLDSTSDPIVFNTEVAARIWTYSAVAATMASVLNIMICTCSIMTLNLCFK